MLQYSIFTIFTRYSLQYFLPRARSPPPPLQAAPPDNGGYQGNQDYYHPILHAHFEIRRLRYVLLLCGIITYSKLCSFYMNGSVCVMFFVSVCRQCLPPSSSENTSSQCPFLSLLSFLPPSFSSSATTGIPGIARTGEARVIPDHGAGWWKLPGYGLTGQNCCGGCIISGMWLGFVLPCGELYVHNPVRLLRLRVGGWSN